MDAKGMNQQDLVRATGLHAATVSKLYRNRFDRIDIATATTICQYFNLKSISELVELSEQ